MKRIAYNDILEKGFDSVAQECFLWINKPDLASEVYNRHGHAPDWNRLKRDKGGRYHHIAKVTQKLVRLADSFDQAGNAVAANKVDELIRCATEATSPKLEKLMNTGENTDGSYSIVWGVGRKTEGTQTGTYGDIQRKMWELSDKGYRQYGRELGDCAV